MSSIGRDKEAMPPRDDTIAVADSAMSGRPSFADTIRLIHGDFAFRRSLEPKTPGRLRSLRLFMSRASACGVRYRLQGFFYANRLAPLGRILKYANLMLYGVDIDQRAQIGAGFLIGHPGPMTITADVVIGERCIVYHQTMIGRSPFCEPDKKPGPLVVGNDVTFGPGSCAYGAITIGDGCRIGANAVVDRSFPPGSTLMGVPARAASKPQERKEPG